MASSNYDTEWSDADEGGMTYDAVWCDSARESHIEKVEVPLKIPYEFNVMMW